MAKLPEWTDAETARLLAAVERFTTGRTRNWVAVAAEVGRGASACEARFYRIAPAAGRRACAVRPWTESEDAELQRRVAHARGMGVTLDWARIGRALGRSFTATRARFYRLEYAARRDCLAAEARVPMQAAPGAEARTSTVYAGASARIEALAERIGIPAVRALRAVPRGRGEIAALAEVQASHGLTHRQAQSALHVVRAG